MKEKSVTVLITVKNSKNTIKNCIDSVLKLNYKNYKVYVVDAFSTDGTYEILKSYGKKIKVEQYRGNPPKAYNYAIKKINTEFIAFTDGDCVVDKNWLKNLLSSFESEEIGAVIGFCKTPKNVNFLQKLIGIELESRFKSFSKFITRGPTMNLCVRTKVAKSLKFDEELDVSYDADFGYRLTKMGKKIVYQPKAVVYHYHRATWKNFFRQQIIYGRFVPELYLKHKMIKGDYITKSSMLIQPFILLLFLAFLILSLIFSKFLIVSCILVFLLSLIYLSEFCKLKTKKYYLFPYLLLFFVRNVAWCLGLILWIKYVILEK
jgi:cellulose synthase/poly-beta-1,6-N-acetylglucosamine synthase-like glycosyltransferase